MLHGRLSLPMARATGPSTSVPGAFALHLALYVCSGLLWDGDDRVRLSASL